MAWLTLDWHSPACEVFAYWLSDATVGLGTDRPSNYEWSIDLISDAPNSHGLVCCACHYQKRGHIIVSLAPLVILETPMTAPLNPQWTEPCNPARGCWGLDLLLSVKGRP